jgi:trehalose 6-phosphate phosphatase
MIKVVSVGALPHALRDGDQFDARLNGRQPAVFLDYDGTLTPIVDRPQDAVISDTMRNAVRRLAQRTTVCVVSGRDRSVVAEWLGIDGLVVAGSHGFDIAGDIRGQAPDGEGSERIQHHAVTGFEDLLATITERLHSQLAQAPGAAVEPKRFSVAVHYRLVDTAHRPLVTRVVDDLLAEYPDQLKLTPGKMVYEIQPKVDWDKGRAVEYLRHALGVDGPDYVTLYLGDDITDEDAFRALKGPANGIGVIIADTSDPEVAGRDTAADFVLESMGEVEQFLDMLA